MQYAVNAVFSVGYTRSMLYSVYGTRWKLVILAGRDPDGQINFVLLRDGEVEDNKLRDQKRWGKSSWKTGTWSISCVSQSTIPDTAGMSPNLACNHTDTRSSQSNHASCTPDFSFTLVSSKLFSSSSAISLFLVHNSTIIAEQKVKSSLCILPCHDHEVTPNTAYTEYSSHWR